jgi:hypothetical protein
MNPETTLGYFKYDGLIVQEGIIDARAAAKALEGLDSAMRFFIAQERKDLAEVDIPIPVRIEKGSWVADIPTHAGALITTGFGVVAFGYLKKAAEKMAEKDFSDTGIKDVLTKSIKSVQWFISVAKHLGHTNIKRAVLNWTKEEHVGFVNDSGAVIYVPVSYLKPLASAPVTLLSDLAGVVEAERILKVGTSENGKFDEVEITKKDRQIFADDEDDTEILFPELVHGQQVELEGVVTRGNEMSNTIGFWFQNHILTCRPSKGNIVSHKKQLFLNCRIYGEITRMDKKGNPTEPRPKIVFNKLVALSNQEQSSLPFAVEGEDED